MKAFGQILLETVINLANNLKNMGKEMQGAVKLGLILCVALLSSCLSSRRLNYLQAPKRAEQAMTDSSVVHHQSASEYVIKAKDQLYIKFFSTDEATDAFLNSPKYQMPTSNYASKYQDVYVVNNQGYITLPTLGKLNVMGSTTDALREDLQQQIDEKYNYTTVVVHLAGFHVTILGEVKLPGRYLFDKEKVTIFDLIGQAGDISYAGDRRKVKLVRHNNNSTETKILDLTNSEIIVSDYYYLKPNDLFYVEPINPTFLASRRYPFLSVFTGVVASLSTLAIVLIDLNR